MNQALRDIKEAKDTDDGVAGSETVGRIRAPRQFGPYHFGRSQKHKAAEGVRERRFEHKEQPPEST